MVVGFDADGTAAVQADGPAPAVTDLPPSVGASLVDIWRSDAVPLTAAGTDDPTDAPFDLMPTGSLFRVIDLEPGDHEPMWHQTASVDFNLVESGAIRLLISDENDPTHVDLVAGDTIVVRGVRHAWQNRESVPCRLVCTSIAATLPDSDPPT